MSHVSKLFTLKAFEGSLFLNFFNICWLIFNLPESFYFIVLLCSKIQKHLWFFLSATYACLSSTHVNISMSLCFYVPKEVCSFYIFQYLGYFAVCKHMRANFEASYATSFPFISQYKVKCFERSWFWYWYWCQC